MLRTPSERGRRLLIVATVLGLLLGVATVAAPGAGAGDATASLSGVVVAYVDPTTTPKAIPTPGGFELRVDWVGPDGRWGGDDDVRWTVVTGADGSFRLDGLPAGRYFVTVGLGTYVERGVQVGTQTTSGLEFWSIDLPAGGEVEAVVPVVGRHFTYVVGRFDMEGLEHPKHLDGLESAATWTGWDGIAGTEDDVELTMVVSGVFHDAPYHPKGDIVLRFGGAELERLGLLRVTGDNARPLTGSPPMLEIQTSGPVTFGFTGIGSMAGSVRLDVYDTGVHPSPPGGWADRAGVALTWAGPDGDLSTEADGHTWRVLADNGEYQLDGLPFGLYLLEFDWDSYSRSAVAGPGGRDQPERAIVEITADRPHRLDLDLVLRAIYSLGGRFLLDLDGDDLPAADEPGLLGVPVELTRAATSDREADLHYARHTDAGGRWRVDHIVHGTWQLRWNPPAWAGLVAGSEPAGTWRDPQFPDHLRLMNGYDDPLTPHDETNWQELDVALRGTSSLSGVVAGFGPGGPAAVNVTWAGFDRSMNTVDDVTISASLDAGGSFHLEHLPGGRYTVALDPSDADHVVSTPVTLELAPGEHTVVEGLSVKQPDSGPPGLEPSTPRPVSTREALPITGASTGVMGAVGLVLLAGGAVLCRMEGLRSLPCRRRRSA